MVCRNILLGAMTGLVCIGGAFGQPRSIPGIDQEAPLDRAVDIPRQKLVAAFRRMKTENISTIRMLEGGEYNVNIRHDENVTPENLMMRVHPDTIDVWVVQEGSGTLVTGGENVSGAYQGGMERFISMGDLIFIPAGVPHGMKEASSITCTWLNIRFPEHRN